MPAASSGPCADESAPDSCASTPAGSRLAPTVTATPFRKSRRVMRRFIPSSRSCLESCSSCPIWLPLSFVARASSPAKARRKREVRNPNHKGRKGLQGLSLSHQLPHRPPGLVNGLVGVRRRRRIRIGDGYPPKALPPDHVGPFCFRPFRIE